jgi:elongation factor Ts
MSFTAKDVQALRQATGAGMMDAKKALEANNGDAEAASQWLREKGLGKAAERSDRENNQGAVALVIDGNVAAMVHLKCETDFVASSDQYKELASDMAAAVAAKGEGATAEFSSRMDDLKLTLKENIDLGTVVRFEAAAGNVLDSYLHIQGGRGVNGVLIEVAGGSQELAHDIAVHVGFARPKYLAKSDVPQDVLDKERATLEAITLNEGKPAAAVPKIVEGRIQGFFKDVALLEQPYAKDDKVSITQLLNGATIVRYAQVEIG